MATLLSAPWPLGNTMNAPKQPASENEALEKVKQQGAKQRGDYTGQFTEDVDNAEEIRAIENDPTQFPNSTRIYVQGEIHPTVMFHCARSDSPILSIQMERLRKMIPFEFTTVQDPGAIQNLKETLPRACPRCGCSGFSIAATWRSTMVAM